MTTTTKAPLHVGKRLAAMLAGKNLAGVTPEGNLRKRISRTLLSSTNKAAHSGFETQRRRHQKKSKTGVSMAPEHGLMSFKKLKIKGSCFPPTASVSLENGELVTMSQLQLGNQVQTGRHI